MTEKQNRQLAAILFADIAGYTALMQKDEDEASILLRRFQKSIDKEVAAYNGQVINFYGDGALSIFHSTKDAAQCAMKLQQEFKKNPYVPVRIGIHYGTVVFENEKVFGHSVNLASRIESIGMPEAVLFSKKVNEAIKNEEGITTSYIGSFNFKNVKEPTEIYAIANDGFKVPRKEEIQGKIKATNEGAKYLKILIPVLVVLLGIIILQVWRTNAMETNQAQAELKKASIAVLPFQDRSPEGDQEYFGFGIAEEILNTLGQLRALKVAGRTSSFSFKEKELTIAEIGQALGVEHILEGSVAKHGKKIRINIQLINVADGFNIWSQKYDTDYDDIFRIQDEVALNVGEALLKKLAPEQIKQLQSDSNQNSGAYELYLKAKYIHREQYAGDYGEGEFKNSEKLFLEAIALDSNFALAYAGLADLYDTYLNMGMPEESSREIEIYEQSRLELSASAMQLNPNISYINEVRGHIHLNANNDLDNAYQLFSQAYKLNPNNASALVGICEVYLYKSLIDDAIALNEKALEIDPLRPWHHGYQAYAYAMIGDFEKAIERYNYSIQMDSTELVSQHELAELYTYLNQKKKALEIYQQLEKKYPSFFEWDSYHGKMVEIINGQKIDGTVKVEMPYEQFFQYYMQRNNLLYYLNGDTDVFKQQIQGWWNEWRKRDEFQLYSLYLHLTRHPIYEELNSETWFQEILKAEKEKYNSFISKYPRAEEIFSE